MSLFHIVVLALIQGITEFLPVSSSGHLVILPAVTPWKDQGLLIDVAVHVGSLLAVMIYFMRDIARVVVGLGRLAMGRTDSEASLAANLIVCSIPAGVAGIALHAAYPEALRSIEVVAWTMIGFGVLLFFVDKVCMTVRRLEHMTWIDAVVIGMAQVLALIPGTSRAGITITAGRAMGLERDEAARFSMLMSIPVILGAGLLGVFDLIEIGEARVTMDAAIAAGIAFVSALASIAAMMAWLRASTFAPFVLYRLFLGGALLYWIYGFGGAPFFE